MKSSVDLIEQISKNIDKQIFEIYSMNIHKNVL